MGNSDKDETLWELVYTSVESREMTLTDLKDILNVAREYNPKHQLTGCLIYQKQQFLQLLEGPRYEVMEMLDRISTDNRHQKIKIIWESAIDTRSFSEWSMYGATSFSQVPRPLEDDIQTGLFDLDKLIQSGKSMNTGREIFAEIKGLIEEEKA